MFRGSSALIDSRGFCMPVDRGNLKFWFLETLMREEKRGFVRSNLVLTAVENAVLLSPPAVRADDISFVNTFRNIAYEQTGNGNMLSLNGTFFSADITTTSANPYTSASVNIPGNTNVALPQQTSTDYGFQTG